MPKSIEERLAWWNGGEERPWKRKVDALGMIVVAFSVLLSLGTFIYLGSQKPFRFAVLLFGGALFVALIAAFPIALRNDTISRWARSAIGLGLVCGAGLLASLAFTILAYVPDR